ncbi:NTP transferase domain-containing protein [Polynucleobacter paludilacus]|uniref:sugar phosphate nucleotidyltransferase n=1 Tax=Polynucleobacter paludilacus TaxID=1855895 RepID=UPI001BFEA878|nr:sugar phosphate nucleotidyltransferase [Polynucleobacter paludilacus]QWD87333.1 NTP transferase domain-containing protein [Polynucleobacter paludilacus]
MLSKTCIVLAGGLGTRLRSAVPSVPKCLAPIAGKPFMRWQLESLAQRGIENFILSLGYGSEQILDAIRSSWAKKLNIEYVVENQSLGTGGATQFVMLEAGLSEALVANGDTFLGGPLDSMFVPLDLRGGELMRIASVLVQNRNRFGGIELDQENHVVNFLDRGQTGPGQINAGLYRISNQAFADQPSDVFSLETAVMSRLVLTCNLQARQLAGPFIDIGVPDDYYLFKNLYQNYIN